jgi:DNA ligase-1
MNDFATLFFQLDQTNKINDKIAAIETFLLKASSSDRIWMIALFTGRHPKRTISSHDLKEWVIEISQQPKWLFEECHHVIGDLAETLALLLPQHSSTYQSSLTEWMLTIEGLKQKNLTEKKESIFQLWSQLDPKECLVFNKVLIGGFRLGVSQNLLIRALSNTLGLDANLVAHRLMGNWNPATVDPELFLKGSSQESLLSQPYPFCLAYPLDIPLEELGMTHEWFAEWKWDGIRGQIVNRKGVLTVWSRGEEVVNAHFPELLQLQSILPSGIVLDGEILAYHEDQVLPFQYLQQRIGRKKVTPAILRDIPVIFLAYDLLEWEGMDQRVLPLRDRRSKLETLFQSLPHSSLLRLSPIISANNWDELRQVRLESRSKQAEGLMLKKADSVYHIGRKRGEWWKWKVESYTVDAVLLYAQKGHGWRANVFSDYTFAVWHEGQLIPFAKAYSGLTKEELKEVDRFIKTHTLEKFGPVRSVKPELVFEIAFEGIQFSNRHKSGIAVRFPRIQRWRHDKKSQEADTLDTLKALIFTPK